jgi:hypothetical protein
MGRQYTVFDTLPPEDRKILASLPLCMVAHPSEFWAVPKAAPEIELALSPDS